MTSIATIDVRATKTISVTLLGAGTVNGALATLIAERGKFENFELEVTQALVNDATEFRQDILPERLIDDPSAIEFENTDIVIEALGGIEPARTLVVAALHSGIPVVSANKTLIAHHGEELLRAAKRGNTTIRFEAAVGAATPCLRVLRDTLKGVGVRRIYGVLNGTSHFVLNEIANPGASLDAAVRTAQVRGYAEQDPSADLEGHDAAQKLAILSWSVSGELLDPTAIPRVELPTLSPSTVAAAAQIGFTVKPLAALSWDKEGAPDAWIAPAAVPTASPLAATQGVTATIVVETSRAGTLLLSAPGAGGFPTASALFDDLIDIVDGRADQGTTQSSERIDLGGAGDAHDWVVHAPVHTGFDGARLARHIADSRGHIERFENLGDAGFVAHVSGVSYDPSFTEPLTRAGACVLEVVQ